MSDFKEFKNPWSADNSEWFGEEKDKWATGGENNEWLQKVPESNNYDFKKIKITDYDYSKIESNYKRNGKKILDTEECLEYLRDKNPPTNTCAIKLSYALNKSAYYIPNPNRTPENVRIQRDKTKINNNFVLDAESMVNYFKLIEKPTLSFFGLDTYDKVNEAISNINEYDDMKGIIGLVAGDKEAYKASGHVDLIYEDFMWDLSFYGSGSGADIGPYIKQRLNIKFDMYIWILDYD